MRCEHCQRTVRDATVACPVCGGISFEHAPLPRPWLRVTGAVVVGLVLGTVVAVTVAQANGWLG